LDNARDPLEAMRALDARLPQAMQNADLDLLAPCAAILRGGGTAKVRTRPKTVPDATRKALRRARLRRGRHLSGIGRDSPWRRLACP
jgi:hypothetical protein